MCRTLLWPGPKAFNALPNKIRSRIISQQWSSLQLSLSACCARPSSSPQSWPRKTLTRSFRLWLMFSRLKLVSEEEAAVWTAAQDSVRASCCCVDFDRLVCPRTAGSGMLDVLCLPCYMRLTSMLIHVLYADLGEEKYCVTDKHCPSDKPYCVLSGYNRVCRQVAWIWLLAASKLWYFDQHRKSKTCRM